MSYYRKGQDRWVEWEGEGFDPKSPGSLTYFTLGYLDTNSETQIDTIALALRRDGVADGWSDSQAMVENLVFTSGYVAETDEGDYVFWNSSEDEEPVDGLLYEPATFVEVTVD